MLEYAFYLKIISLFDKVW